MTTIKDVASKANVSTATVSRILSNDESLSVGEDTRKRVIETAKLLNYKPARRKNSKSSEQIPNIGLVLTSSQEDEINDPYYLSIRLGIEMACEHHKLRINTIIRLNQDIDTNSFDELDGIIIVGSISDYAIQKIKKNKKEIVFVNFDPKLSGCDVVISDLASATERVLEHLMNLNHTQIGYIGGMEIIKDFKNNIESELDDIRKVTFQKIMHEKGLLINEHVLISSEWGPNGGYQLMKEMIRKGNLPTAIVVASDPMAMGALRALHETNIKVPDDVSIFSFDDIESAAYLSPPLTTVKVYPDEMGKTAVKLLKDRINGRKVAIKTVLETDLVLRESCQYKKE
ncbi:LacI family DNA-binding transcriptional regulator [Metabacillus sp. FJAT-53654]|uniref:LacI family DNA-binding transcriptional regulator n=1 Tax=Metabacillus rhizosphaerae TaxID=3117747 RepID=A0ABZ2MSZ7_9BACI